MELAAATQVDIEEDPQLRRASVSSAPLDCRGPSFQGSGGRASLAASESISPNKASEGVDK